MDPTDLFLATQTWSPDDGHAVPTALGAVVAEAVRANAHVRQHAYAARTPRYQMYCEAIGSRHVDVNTVDIDSITDGEDGMRGLEIAAADLVGKLQQAGRLFAATMRGFGASKYYGPQIDIRAIRGYGGRVVSTVRIHITLSFPNVAALLGRDALCPPWVPAAYQGTGLLRATDDLVRVRHARLFEAAVSAHVADAPPTLPPSEFAKISTPPATTAADVYDRVVGLETAGAGLPDTIYTPADYDPAEIRYMARLSPTAPPLPSSEVRV